MILFHLIVIRYAATPYFEMYDLKGIEMCAAYNIFQKNTVKDECKDMCFFFSQSSVGFKWS